MLESIREFAYWLGIDPLWIYTVVALIFLLLGVKCVYPWDPKWKSVTTKDKDGKLVTRFFHLDI